MSTQPRNQYGWNENDLRQQFETAKSFGWLPFFEAAAYATGFEVEQLLALGSRESGSLWRIHPDGLISGDRGYAIGIVQLNRHAIPDAFENKEPEKNLLRGARELAANKQSLKRHTTAVPGDIMARMIYASYNRGATGARLSYEQHGDPDFTTAHRNYGADCVAREAVFSALLDAEENLGDA